MSQPVIVSQLTYINFIGYTDRNFYVFRYYELTNSSTNHIDYSQ